MDQIWSSQNQGQTCGTEQLSDIIGAPMRFHPRMPQLFAGAAWAGGSRVIGFAFAGVLCGAATTLALLRDADIAGSAAAGFWVMMLAVWLGAALCVVQLAS